MKYKKTFLFILLLTYFIFYSFFIFADSIGPGGSINSDLNNLKDAVDQWGQSASGIAVLISAGLAVSSLLIPWKFYKETLGRPAWMSLACSVLLYIVMSYFGNSIRPYIVNMVQCPKNIIGLTCN